MSEKYCTICQKPESAFMMGLPKDNTCYPCWIDRAEKASADVIKMKFVLKTIACGACDDAKKLAQEALGVNFR